MFCLGSDMSEAWNDEDCVSKMCNIRDASGRKHVMMQRDTQQGYHAASSESHMQGSVSKCDKSRKGRLTMILECF